MKKIISILLVFTFLFSFNVNAFAQVKSTDISAQQIVDNANQEINQIITSTIEKSEKVLTKYASSKITFEEKEAKIDELINYMLTKTSKISQNAQRKCAKFGVLTQCTYVEVLIDKKIILVDPVMIVGT